MTIGAGIAVFPTGSAASPERAAQAAAGIAHSDWSAENRTTSLDGRPRAAERKRSIAAARSNSVSPAISAVLKPDGRATSGPTRITWASWGRRSDPCGPSRSSTSSVTPGSSSPSESRIGAPIGGPVSTDAEIPVIQSSCSTSATAVGRSESPVAG